MAEETAVLQGTLDQFTATLSESIVGLGLHVVATWRGFVYVAFVIDVFARRIVGWRASTSMRSDLALDALGKRCTIAKPISR